MADSERPTGTALRALSLFTGVGGLDLGIEKAGHSVIQQCENWPPARRVLSTRFPGVPLHDDVCTLRFDEPYDLLLAGFPCTDISHAGRREGIAGAKSGLVSEVFRVASESSPRWILLENVPNLLWLHAGEGMRVVTEGLEKLGYRWAFRTVDSRFTGVPQRRPRILILASRDKDPRAVLLDKDAGAPPERSLGDGDRLDSGFYWTEGRTGVGLVAGAIPTLKGGSTLGLLSAPAVWLPEAALGHRFVLPTIEDGEALQGLPRGWTKPAVIAGEPDLRWKLVGNAVTVGVGQWIGERLAAADGSEYAVDDPVVSKQSRWPNAGWGDSAGLHVAAVSAWPERLPPVALNDIVDPPSAKPLSHRATSGFLSRLDEVSRSVPKAFYADLEAHQAATRPAPNLAWSTSPATRSRMSAQQSAGTKPEARLEGALRSKGLVFVQQRRPEPDLRCRLDFVFEEEKVAVDVRGCFWHACPIHGSFPRSNAERWAEKLKGNVDRDERNLRDLRSRGWLVRIVWEHEDPMNAAQKIARCVRRRQRQSGARATP